MCFLLKLHLQYLYVSFLTCCSVWVLHFIHGHQGFWAAHMYTHISVTRISSGVLKLVMMVMTVEMMLTVLTFTELMATASPWWRRKRAGPQRSRQAVWDWWALNFSAGWGSSFGIFILVLSPEFILCCVPLKSVNKLINFALQDTGNSRLRRALECCTDQDYCNRDLHPTLPPINTPSKAP